MAANGFYATAWVYVQPAYIDPPKLTSGLALGTPSNGTIKAAYRLNSAAGRTDQSLVNWFSCDDPSCGNPRAMAVSRGDAPLATYTLMPGDAGRYIQASIQPKLDISDPGPPVTAVTASPIPKSAIVSTTVSPDFANFVITPNSSY